MALQNLHDLIAWHAPVGQNTFAGMWLLRCQRDTASLRTSQACARHHVIAVSLLQSLTETLYTDTPLLLVLLLQGLAVKPRKGDATIFWSIRPGELHVSCYAALIQLTSVHTR
jgi:hypothetical protein